MSKIKFLIAAIIDYLTSGLSRRIIRVLIIRKLRHLAKQSDTRIDDNVVDFIDMVLAENFELPNDQFKFLEEILEVIEIRNPNRSNSSN